jgi:hypothetical protein
MQPDAITRSALTVCRAHETPWFCSSVSTFIEVFDASNSSCCASTPSNKSITLYSSARMCSHLLTWLGSACMFISVYTHSESPQCRRWPVLPRHGASSLPALQVLRAGGRRSVGVCHPWRTVASARLCQPHMEGLGAVQTGSQRGGRRADRRLHAAQGGLDEGRLPRRHGGHVLLLARLERLVLRVSPPS